MKRNSNKEIKNILSQYYDIKQEIAELKNKINDAEMPNNITDIVQGSSKQFPYTMHPIKVTGLKIEKKSKINNYKKILENRLLDLLEARANTETFINTLPTSRLRRIFTMKYIDGFSWTKIAFKIGRNATADSVRKEHDRFLENI